jgi:hypothetical protein
MIYDPQHMVLTCEHGKPLLKGTVLDLQPYSPHTVVVGYDASGRQVIGHNSKQHGRAVLSWPEEFNEHGRIPFRIVRFVISPEEGEQIWQSVLNDVRRGVRWLPGDNCQDLATRAVTGHNGSPTRDALVGLACVGALVFVAVSLSQA